ncbi:MAG: IclR family transcriptional regulator [Pseudonocardia sp.]|nr:IclR family transcriptional regulator [Pseudonocardia sp.]
MAETNGGTGATERVADVLLLFTDGPSTLGVTRVSRELGLSKAVVHRILQSLTSRELTAYDPASREYRLGPAAAALGGRAMRDSDLRTAALPELSGLRDELAETATLSARVHGGRVYLDQVVGTHEITMSVEIGRRFPLHAGSSGKCMLAFGPDERVDETLAADLAALTPSTITDPDALRAELALIRERGYAASAGERQADAGSVAAPVFGPSGDVVGAISVCGPRFRVTDEFVAATAPEVIAAAERTTRRLGGHHEHRRLTAALPAAERTR